MLRLVPGLPEPPPPAHQTPSVPPPTSAGYGWDPAWGHRFTLNAATNQFFYTHLGEPMDAIPAALAMLPSCYL